MSQNASVPEDSKIILPSKIRFSQDSILNKFSVGLDRELIGVVLDRILSRDEKLLQRILANMQVARCKKPGHEGLWFTVNNRSLWVLKQLELLGMIKEPITVEIDSNGIDNRRFTTRNNGECIEVRGDNVGGRRAKAAPFWRYRTQRQGLRAGADGAMDDEYDSDEYYEGDVSAAVAYESARIMISI